MVGSGRVHDRGILDALEKMEPVALNTSVWRITRIGRDPIRGSVASGRWTPGGGVEVLYTSVEREGALAEIGFRLSLEPVWPSRIQHEIHEIRIQTSRTLQFANIGNLAAFGVDIARYDSFDYAATQALAAAAHFMEFDGLLVPSARHRSHNLVVFMDRDGAASIERLGSEIVDWTSYNGR